MRADIGERTSRAVVSAAWREAETSSARAARSAADGPAASSSPRPSAASASASVLKAYITRRKRILRSVAKAERKRGELAGEVTSELQVVGKAASIAIQTWVRNNDKTKARAEEREKNIGWTKRLFTAWRVSHAERKEAGEDDPEEDETPVAPEGDPSACIIREGTSVRRESGPEQRYDLAANDRSGRQKTRPCARRAR